MPSRDKTTELLLLAVALIWASNYPLTKFGLAALDIFVFNSIRFLVAFVLLVVIMSARSISLKVDSSDRKSIFQLGIIVSIIYQCAFILGIKNTSSGNAAVILSTSPLWTAFFSARIHKVRVLPQTWIGLALSLVGIVLIIIGSGKKFDADAMTVFGDVMVLVAAILWGLNTTLQKPLLTRYSTIELSVMTLGIGAVGLTLIAIPPALTMDWTSVTYPYILAAVLSGLLSIGTANVLWSYGVKKIGPSRTANFNNLVPIFAFLIAYVTIGESVAVLQLLGAGITLCGVWIVRR
jgi:drug/metabolite transporter (DMT)-like permease